MGTLSEPVELNVVTVAASVNQSSLPRHMVPHSAHLCSVACIKFSNSIGAFLRGWVRYSHKKHDREQIGSRDVAEQLQVPPTEVSSAHVLYSCQQKHARAEHGKYRPGFDDSSWRNFY